jgi:hypothetical protein
MSKNQETYNKQDLFQSGKAYRNSFLGQGDDAPPNVNYPYSGGFPQSGTPEGQWTPGANLPVPSQPAADPSSFLGKLPIKDIKNIVDRMGGIEGIMGMANKVNSMFKTFQQMAPMFKLLMGSFGKAKTANSRRSSYKRKRKPRSRRRSSSSSVYKKSNSQKHSAKKNRKRRS